VQIDGRDVTACVGADFGASVNLDPIVVRMRSVANACGTACTTLCGTGRTVLVFYGQERGSYEFAEEIALTSAFRDYPITLRLASRYLLVCRDGSGAARDDLTIDSILSHAPCP
jgi:hypothetical protein